MSTLYARYWAHVDVRGPDECHLWTGSLRGSPYGLLWDGTYLPSGGPRQVQATRVGWRLRKGEIPDGMGVLHTCDNPPCHNERHWFLGTNHDNILDKWTKGRGVVPDNRGEKHGMSKLTSEQVEEIISKYSTGGVLQSALAREYGIAQQQVSKIVNGLSWGHAKSTSGSETAS